MPLCLLFEEDPEWCRHLRVVGDKLGEIRGHAQEALPCSLEVSSHNGSHFLRIRPDAVFANDVAKGN